MIEGNVFNFPSKHEVPKHVSILSHHPPCAQR